MWIQSILPHCSMTTLWFRSSREVRLLPCSRSTRTFKLTARAIPPSKHAASSHSSLLGQFKFYRLTRTQWRSRWTLKIWLLIPSSRPWIRQAMSSRSKMAMTSRPSRQSSSSLRGRTISWGNYSCRMKDWCNRILNSWERRRTSLSDCARLFCQGSRHFLSKTRTVARQLMKSNLQQIS